MNPCACAHDESLESDYTLFVSPSVHSHSLPGQPFISFEFPEKNTVSDCFSLRDSSQASPSELSAVAAR